MTEIIENNCIGSNKIKAPSAKGAVFQGPGRPFAIREFEVVKAPKGYGRSELIASGVCGTDLHFQRGTLFAPADSIVGHEFVGRLNDCDPEEAAKYGLKPGDNVIADIAVPCGKCLLCLSGDDANCTSPPKQDSISPSFRAERSPSSVIGRLSPNVGSSGSIFGRSAWRTWRMHLTPSCDSSFTNSSIPISILRPFLRAPRHVGES